MATTQVSTEYVLRAIDNLEKHVSYMLPAKKIGYEERKSEYNASRGWFGWLKSDYEDTVEGMIDIMRVVFYASEECIKADNLKLLIDNSETGEITIDDDEAAMLKSFLNMKTGD